jgi:hypothetical protein
MPKKNPKSTLPSLTDEQIHEIALGIFKNDIFTDRHVREGDQNLMTMIFMPLGFLDKRQILDLQRKARPGLLYAHMRNAGPRAINGYPMFMEMSMAGPQDATKIWNEYKRLSEISGHDA